MPHPDDLQPTEADVEVDVDADQPVDADAEVHRETMGDPAAPQPGVGEAFRAGG